MATITIGRSSINSIKLDDNSVSRHHAVIIYKPDGSLAIMDKSSKNGTRVNGKSLEPEQEYFIYRGDVIRLADKVELNWDLIPEIPPKMTIFKTSLGRGVMSVIHFIAESKEVLNIFKNFVSIVFSGGQNIISLATRPNLSKTDYIPYLFIGMTLFLVSLLKSAKELAPDKSLLVEFSKYLNRNIDQWLFMDAVASVFFLCINYCLVYASYKVFKWYTDGKDKHFDDYFKIFCYTFGTTYWLLTIILLPLTLGCMYYNSDQQLCWPNVSLITGGAMMIVSLISFFIWMRLNDRFWS